MRSSRQLLAVGLALLLLFSGVAGFACIGGAQEGATECSYPLTVTDSTGENVTIDEPPERVVTLAPSATQTMWEIGAQEAVVGISELGTYLKGTDDKAIISGDDGTVSTEKVVAQDPDLVLAPNVIEDEKVEQLREDTDLTVYHFGAATSLADVADKTRLTGRLVNHCDGANARAETFETTIENVRSAVEGEEEPTVLYLLGGEYTAGSGTFIHDVIETAGGTNVAAEAGIEGYAQISREVVADRNPEYILLNTGSPDAIPAAEAYNNTAAVQNDRIVTVEANYLNQPAPRTSLVVEDLASVWHSAAYEASGETLVEDTTAMTSEEPTTATESPGFGVVTALLALLGLLLTGRFE